MKTNFKRIGKQSLSIVLAVMMMVSTMLVGMVTSNAATEATAKVYVCLSDISTFSSYISSDGTLNSSYTLKANAQLGGSGDGANIWKSSTFSKYDKTINGKVVYVADVTYYSDWGGLNTLQIQIYSGSTYKTQISPINNSWTTASTFSGKLYNGSSWVTPNWDSETPTTEPTTVAPTTQPTTTPVTGTKTLYVRNSANWNNVYVYIWKSSDSNNNDWCGEEMTKLDGTDDVYYYVLPDQSNTDGYCIFNPQGNNGQSADLVLADQIGKIYDNKNKTSEPYTPPTQKHSVKLSSDSSPKATVKIGSSELPVAVEENATYTLTVTPNDGYYITSVTVGGESQDISDSRGENNFSLTMGTADVEVKVETAEIQKYSVTIADYDTNKGSVSVSATGKLEENETFTVTATAVTGYAVDTITVKSTDGTVINANDDGSYTMPASDVTVEVTFKEAVNTITFTDITGTTGCTSSTISHQGEVAYGTEVTVTVKVADGYEAALNLGDVEVTKAVDGNTYTFTFNMPATDITVAPTVGVKNVGKPIVTLAGATTGATLKTNVNKNEVISAEVVLSDSSNVAIDEDKTGFAQLTYNGNPVDMNNYIVANSASLSESATFTFDKVGTYELTYNAVVYSTLDSTKTASANATLKIEVTYSEVQQAYIDLQTLISDTTKYPESVSAYEYEEDGVEAYNNARATAQTAVDAGLPVYNAVDTYTALKDNLVNAKNNLVTKRAFYIGGQFITADVTDKGWSHHRTDLKFDYVSNNLYKLETGKDIRDNIGNYFLIYSKSGSTNTDYGVNGNTALDNKTNLSTAQSLTEISSTSNKQLYFDNPTSAPKAVIWLDTSGLNDDGSGSMKIFYTAGMPTAMYAITGGGNNGATLDWAKPWSSYDSNYLVSETTENPFVFMKTITVKQTSFFRFITSNGTQYGGQEDQDKLTEAKYTTAKTSDNALKISQLGSYKLYVDQSGATPVVWIEPAAYNVSAKGQYTYDGAVYRDYTSNPPTITIGANQVDAGKSVTVTATDDVTGYKFTGWESEGGTFADATKLETTFTPNRDNAVAIAKYAKEITISVEKAEGSKDGTGEVVAAYDLTATRTFLAGQNIKVTFTPADKNDILTSVIINGTESITAVQDYSITLTAGVTDDKYDWIQVLFTFSDRPQYTYSHGVVNGCESMGSVDSSVVDGTYDYNTEVTLTATANDGYSFVGWYSDINGTGDYVSNKAEYSFKLTEDTELYAKFAEDTGTLLSGLYLIYGINDNNPANYKNYLKLYKNSNNEVYAYFNADSGFDDSKTYRFMISTSAGANAYTNAYSSSNNRTYTDSKYTENISVGGNNYWIGNVQYYYSEFSIKEDSQGIVSSVKVKLGYYNESENKIVQSSATDTTKAYKYEVIPTLEGAIVKKIKVYAKDGTIRSGYQKYADMADTKITNSDLKVTSQDYYNEAYAPVGSTVEIKTTIDSSYRDKYYVKAFSINGYSYSIINASQADTTNGVYTCSYTIPEDCTDKFIEITPIYYYIDETDTVTFYVEGFEENVQAAWGNTIAVHAWYSNGSDTSSSTSSTKNALGGYPGQPMVYEGGKYSMQIPKYLNGVTANKVSGVTMNNYVWDNIHAKNFSSQKNDNAQTYDYDDFYKLANKEDVDNIIFDFRYRTTTDNSPSTSGLSSSTYNKNELEPLTDYYGNIVDLFGNILSETWTTDYDSNYLTVISNGYEKNYIGSYATEWSVYTKDGKYITTITCSQLIDENSVDSSYSTAYERLKPYANLPVKIAYEKSISSGNDYGNRADGRWYYSQKAQKITANTIIQYRDNDDDPFVDDPYVEDTNEGTTTNTKAYFTNADYDGKTTCVGTVDGGNWSLRAETDADANYLFIGWYLKTSDGYAFITSEADVDIPMTNNETYVARFIKTPEGTLTLSHKLLESSANGRTYIKADIVKADGTVVASISETTGNLIVPPKYVNYSSNYSIKVTLRTVPYGIDAVEGFYNYDKVAYEQYSTEQQVQGTEKTYEVTRTIKSLFIVEKDTEGNVIGYELERANVPFYSNIVTNTLEYKITYTYNTRLDGEKEYVIKDVVSGMELEEMWAYNTANNLPKEQLSKIFITKKAPFVSNFREELKWDIDNASINGYVATVNATSKTDDLVIQAWKPDGGWTLPFTLPYGTLATDNGDYIYKTGTDEFPETYKFNDTEYEFSYWAIFDNRDKASEFRTAYENYLKSGNVKEDMVERGADLAQLSGYDGLISKSYSKEYNYISYQNYYIVAVYAGRFTNAEIKESQASIRLLEYTRNQWTTGDGYKGDGETLNDGASSTDYLYTDFALSFDKDQELIKNNTNIEIGITFEVVAKYNDLENLASYVTDSNTDEIGNLVIKASKAGSNKGNIGTYTQDGDSRNVYRYKINNSSISVKNRIEYYLRFKNSETSQQNVMKVYSYIYDKTSGEIYLSDPVYMNMYDIANLTYITSDLADIDIQPSIEAV